MPNNPTFRGLPVVIRATFYKKCELFATIQTLAGSVFSLRMTELDK